MWLWGFVIAFCIIMPLIFGNNEPSPPESSYQKHMKEKAEEYQTAKDNLTRELKREREHFEKYGTFE